MRAEAPILLVVVMLHTLIYCYNNFINENEAVTTEQLAAAIEIRVRSSFINLRILEFTLSILDTC